MPAEGEEAPRTQSVQEQVQGAMAVMQDNMRAMAERDSGLTQLEARFQCGDQLVYSWFVHHLLMFCCKVLFSSWQAVTTFFHTLVSPVVECLL